MPSTDGQGKFGEHIIRNKNHSKDWVASYHIGVTNYPQEFVSGSTSRQRQSSDRHYLRLPKILWAEKQTNVEDCHSLVARECLPHPSPLLYPEHP